MIRLIILTTALLCTQLQAASLGESIYLHGEDAKGNRIKAMVKGLQSSSASACVNCHRESGLGTSESGKTIPPVSWGYLGTSQPAGGESRFKDLRNIRPAYDSASLYRLLTSGVKSNGEMADDWMPIYQLDESQIDPLIVYLKQLYGADDPGVDAETIQIATIVDPRLDAGLRRQHVDFLTGLFGMKNSLTRGELKRKAFAPVQKAPQYESFRLWNLSVWELPLDPADWRQSLESRYQAQPPFVILAPQVAGNYSQIQSFCREHEVPCLFAQGTGDSSGDYYNYVFADRLKQRADLLSQLRRSTPKGLYSIEKSGELREIDSAFVDMTPLRRESLRNMRAHRDEWCGLDGTLLLWVDSGLAEELYAQACPSGAMLKTILLGDDSVDYRVIATLLRQHPDAGICWATNYDSVLPANVRAIRVQMLARKFGMESDFSEELAMDLFAFGLLTDSMSQLAGNFSRKYLLENIEHMLNSYPNLTYFNSITGAPYQRAIVGPYRVYCNNGEST